MGLIKAKDADNLPVKIFGTENEANFYLYRVKLQVKAIYYLILPSELSPLIILPLINNRADDTSG